MMVSHAILGFWFVTPWLFAAGAAATSIPIIIHLLNKRKFRIIVWAAMDFLLAAQRRNARRLKFQRWLLLAVRCLALLVLAAAIGQLVLDNTALGDILGTGRRGVVVVWDDSYSMAYQRPGAESAFDRSKKLLTDWLGKISKSDKVMLIKASRGGVIAGNKPTPDHAALLSQVKVAEVTDAATDLPAALDQAAEAVKDMARDMRTRDVIILTDFSNSSIHDPVRGIGAANRVQGLEGDRLRKAVEAVKENATGFRAFDLGSPDQVNMGVTELRSERPVVVAGTPARFAITVMNAMDRAQIDVPLTVLLDGVVVQTEKLGKIEAGSPRTVLMEVTIPTAGRHLVEARLPADLLGADDVRRLMLNAQREIPILLVDGNPGDHKTLGSVQYLDTAFAKGGQGIFSTKTITEMELPTIALAPFAAVILSDTSAPRGAVVRDNLQKYVESGGLLVIFPGGHTEAEPMNSLLGDRGAKLLPASIGQLMDAPLGARFSPEGFTHPVLAKFGGSRDDYGFATVQTTHYLKLGVPMDGSAETILRYAKEDGTAGDPAIVLKQAGRGKVILFASSADSTWNSWGGKPSFVPVMHELAHYGIAPQIEGLTLHVGDKINLPGDLENPGSWAGPHGVRANITSEVDKDGRPRLTSQRLTAAGTYGPADGRSVVAVNPDAEEVDIRHVPAAAMAATLGIDPKDTEEQPKSLASKAVVAEEKKSGSDFARNLLLAALGFFLLETLLARLFSVYR